MLLGLWQGLGLGLGLHSLCSLLSRGHGAMCADRVGDRTQHLAMVAKNLQLVIRREQLYTWVLNICTCMEMHSNPYDSVIKILSP